MTKYQLINKVYSDNTQEINDRIAESAFPVTHQTLKNFFLKVNDILKSLECLEVGQNFYSSQGLTRILYEHYLVAYFIWTKCRVDNNDDCAIDYSKHYAIFELMKQYSYNSKLDKSYDATKGPLENFLLKAPEFDNLAEPFTQNDFIDVNTRANKFDIRKILQYVRDDLDPTDHFKSHHILILDVCKKYNKTSSYVHGGRMAELEAFEDTPSVDKSYVLKENIEFAKIFSYSILDFIMMLLLAEDRTFVKTYRPIYDFINATRL